MIFPISEIFYSLQGEGRNTGKPSIFVRFWGCNLNCGYCDTPYAVSDNKELQHMSLKDVIDRIEEYPCSHINFTGGEPALFEPQIKYLQDKLKTKQRYTYEIETNGSIKLGNVYDQVNVSYKTSNSGNSPYELKEISPKNDYKFVVSDMKDLWEVEEIIKKYHLGSSIFLMPLGTDKVSQINKTVIDYCLDMGYNYCQRMHIVLFGNKKGV